MVVKATISFFNSYSIKEYGTDKGHEEKYFRYESGPNNKEQIRATSKTPDFNLYFDSGIDDKGDWLQVMKDHKLVKARGTRFNLKVRTLSSNLKTSKKYWMKT